MAEYPIHPYIIHCLEPLLANAAAPVVLALDGRCGSGKTTMAAALAEQFPDSMWRAERTSVEKAGDEMWIAEKFQTNSDIAGSLRNSFRASLMTDYRR